MLVSKGEEEEIDGRSFLLNPNDRQSVSNAGVSCTRIISFWVRDQMWTLDLKLCCGRSNKCSFISHAHIPAFD